VRPDRAGGARAGRARGIADGDRQALRKNRRRTSSTTPGAGTRDAARDEDWRTGSFSTLEVNLDKFIGAVKGAASDCRSAQQESVVAGSARPTTRIRISRAKLLRTLRRRDVNCRASPVFCFVAERPDPDQSSCTYQLRNEITAAADEHRQHASPGVGRCAASPARGLARAELGDADPICGWCIRQFQRSAKRRVPASPSTSRCVGSRLVLRCSHPARVRYLSGTPPELRALEGR